MAANPWRQHCLPGCGLAKLLVLFLAAGIADVVQSQDNIQLAPSVAQIAVDLNNAWLCRFTTAQSLPFPLQIRNKTASATDYGPVMPSSYQTTTRGGNGLFSYTAYSDFKAKRCDHAMTARCDAVVDGQVTVTATFGPISPVADPFNPIMSVSRPTYPLWAPIGPETPLMTVTGWLSG